jgi:hypothetical protein
MGSELYQLVLESGGTHNLLYAGGDDAAHCQNCSNLSAVIMHPHISRLADSLFRNCTKLQLVNIFQKNADTTFSNCGGEYTFASTSLEEVYLPELTTWYNHTFHGNPVLKRLHIYKHTTNATTAFINNGVNNGTNKFHIYSDSAATLHLDNHSSWNNHVIFTKTYTSIQTYHTEQ